MLIKTKPDPQKFLDFCNQDVFGQYEVHEDRQTGCEFGMIAMEHDGMILAKLDAGPWEWYDRASEAVVRAIVQKLGVRLWVCGWSVDREWSWVEHWRPHRKTGEPTLTETVDGQANASVTAKAKERWEIDVRGAFDALHRAAQWEVLRRWLCGLRRAGTQSMVSFLAGNLSISESDKEWIPREWDKLFPGRKPEDGPLHLHAHYLHPEIKAGIERERRLPPEQRKAINSFRAEPPLLSDLGGAGQG